MIFSPKSTAFRLFFFSNTFYNHFFPRSIDISIDENRIQIFTKPATFVSNSLGFPITAILSIFVCFFNSLATTRGTIFPRNTTLTFFQIVSVKNDKRSESRYQYRIYGVGLCVRLSFFSITVYTKFLLKNRNITRRRTLFCK